VDQGVPVHVLAVLALIGFTPLMLRLVALIRERAMSGGSVASRMVGATPL
jgi:hypothetical protein